MKTALLTALVLIVVANVNIASGFAANDSAGVAQENQAFGTNYDVFFAADLGFAAGPEPLTWYYVKGFGGTLGLEFPVGTNGTMQLGLNHKYFRPDAGMILDWYNEPDEYPGRLDPQVSEGAIHSTTVFAAAKIRLAPPAATSTAYLRGGFGMNRTSSEEVRIDFVNEYGYTGTAWHGYEGEDDNATVLAAIGMELGRKADGSCTFVEVGIQTIMTEGESTSIGTVSAGFRR